VFYGVRLFELAVAKWVGVTWLKRLEDLKRELSHEGIIRNVP